MKLLVHEVTTCYFNIFDFQFSIDTNINSYIDIESQITTLPK